VTVVDVVVVAVAVAVAAAAAVAVAGTTIENLNNTAHLPYILHQLEPGSQGGVRRCLGP